MWLPQRQLNDMNWYGLMQDLVLNQKKETWYNKDRAKYNKTMGTSKGM